MNKCVASINQYYENLKYTYKDDDNIMKSQEQIHNLILKFPFTKTDNFTSRFELTASIIQDNLEDFLTICEHVDTVITIVKYLEFYKAFFLYFDPTNNNCELIGNILITIYYIYQEYDIQGLLENMIVEDELEWYFHYKDHMLTYLQSEIIILEDSDLHAVINYLKFDRGACLKKIWVQKSIRDTFMWHLKKNNIYFDDSIQIFQSKQELLTSSTSENIFDKNITVNVVSIWSEDVTAAKNLARSLNQNIVFINTHMDICPDIMLPIKQIRHSQSVITCFDLTVIDKCTNSSIDPTAHKGLTCNLFYDGMWQKPKKNTYWIHKDILFASATSQDIIDCIKSAKKGFKNLSTMSNDSRAQMLSKFATILECDGKFLSSEIVSKWINMSHIYGKNYGKKTFTTKTGRFEVTGICKPKNTVILKEEDEIILFQELTQNLIIGNSVIVICNPDLCILAPYCNMFKMCGIPPGVINLISIKNTNNIACDNIGNEQNVTAAVTKLTIRQQILVAHK